MLLTNGREQEQVDGCVEAKGGLGFEKKKALEHKEQEREERLQLPINWNQFAQNVIDNSH